MEESILKCFSGHLVFLATGVTNDICTSSAIIYEAVNQDILLFSLQMSYYYEKVICLPYFHNNLVGRDSIL